MRDLSDYIERVLEALECVLSGLRRPNVFAFTRLAVDLKDRGRRALEQHYTVLEESDRAHGIDDHIQIVNQSGTEYLVDLKLGACKCPDTEY